VARQANAGVLQAGRRMRPVHLLISRSHRTELAIAAQKIQASGGSVLLAALFHFQLNNPVWPDAQPYDTIVFVAAALAAVALNPYEDVQPHHSGDTGCAYGTG
jgi:hypothetical protein